MIKSLDFFLKNGLDKNEPLGVAIDIQGNVYVSGTFTNSIDSDPGIGVHTLSGSSYTTGFVLKLNNSGNFAIISNDSIKNYLKKRLKLKRCLVVRIGNNNEASL